MYKILLSLFLCIKLCFSISQLSQNEATITTYTNEINDNGYFFKYNLDDGQQREEKGELVTLKNGVQILKVTGFYSFIGDDELEHYTEYSSDENGYRSQTRLMEPSVGIPAAALASLAGGGLG